MAVISTHITNSGGCRAEEGRLIDLRTLISKLLRSREETLRRLRVNSQWCRSIGIAGELWPEFQRGWQEKSILIAFISLPRLGPRYCLEIQSPRLFSIYLVLDKKAIAADEDKREHKEVPHVSLNWEPYARSPDCLAGL